MRLAHRLFVFALSALVMMATFGTARGDDATPADDKAPAATKSQVKVFKLKHRSPQEVQQFVALVAVRRAPGVPAAALRTAMDVKSKSLFVRGDNNAVELFEKVVAHIDRPAAEIGKGTMMDLVIIPLDQENSDNALGILESLGIEPRTVQLEKTMLLVVRGEDEELKNIETILEALDGKADSERAAAE